MVSFLGHKSENLILEIVFVEPRERNSCCIGIRDWSKSRGVRHGKEKKERNKKEREEGKLEVRKKKKREVNKEGAEESKTKARRN